MSDYEVSLSIRYEGNDAADHQLELNQLGESIQGFARILAVSAHVLKTGQYAKQYESLGVKVFAGVVPEHHCYEVQAIIKDIAMSKEFWSGFAGVSFTLLVQYVFSKRSAEEMKHLSAALKQSMGQNAAMVDKLLGTIDRMAAALQPAAKQALRPIGSSCAHIDIYRDDEKTVSVHLDQATKDLIAGAPSNTFTETQEFVGVISEMDMQTGSCKVTLDGDSQDSRISASIVDPVARNPSNAYAVAMAKLTSIRFKAKSEIDSEGSLVKLYISDHIST